MKLITQTGLILSCIASSFIPAAHAAIESGTFDVRMTVLKSCTVTAGSSSDIDLGSVDATAIDTSNSNTISVNCSKTTPYFIGLMPSAANGGNANGAGSMASATAGNTDTIPYQLHQDSATGAIWGNTATTTDAGNGVEGIGSGLAQSFTVYAVAPSANFTPDSYLDTVTVNVNY